MKHMNLAHMRGYFILYIIMCIKHREFLSCCAGVRSFSSCVSDELLGSVGRSSSLVISSDDTWAIGAIWLVGSDWPSCPPSSEFYGRKKNTTHRGCKNTMPLMLHPIPCTPPVLLCRSLSLYGHHFLLGCYLILNTRSNLHTHALLRMDLKLQIKDVE